ncbi:PTS fructose transporter subunit IIC, partial [Listeria monocytogenes]|nr:PTS fructose transporter subunit IIC [Listeria monocytogenes]
WLPNWVKQHVRITGPSARSLPLIILTLITVGATGILMSLIIGGPLGWLNQTLLYWVTEMCKNDTNVIILALNLGEII